MYVDHDLCEHLQFAFHERIQRGADTALGRVLDGHHAEVGPSLRHLGEDGVDTGDGLELDGATIVEIPDSESLRLGKEQTITAWVYAIARVGDWARIVGKGESGPRNYGLWTSASGHLLFQIYGGANCNAYNPNGDDDESFVPEGEWTHIAGTYDGEKVKIFTNGSEVGKFAADCNTDPNVSADPLTFGKLPGLHTFFVGIIDEVGIFSAVLSGNEIEDVMNKGLEGFLGVEPAGKLATTWGKLRGQ